MYRSTLSTWALVEGGRLRVSASLHRGKSPRYTLDRKLGLPKGRSERYGEVRHYGVSNSDSSVVQPVGCHYTNCVTAPDLSSVGKNEKEMCENHDISVSKRLTLWLVREYFLV